MVTMITVMSKAVDNNNKYRIYYSEEVRMHQWPKNEFVFLRKSWGMQRVSGLQWVHYTWVATNRNSPFKRSVGCVKKSVGHFASFCCTKKCRLYGHNPHFFDQLRELAMTWCCPKNIYGHDKPIFFFYSKLDIESKGPWESACSILIAELI